MCLLILINGLDPDYPILVAGNRDEERARKAAPPGLFVGDRRRMLSPRDRRAGGTWMAVNEVGLFAGLTNVAGAPAVPRAPSRGHLPHTALDQDDLASAEEAVRAAVAATPHASFQLVLADGRRARVLRHDRGELTAATVDGPVVVTNEHAVGELTLPLEPALVEGLTVDARLDALADLLIDTGEATGHAVLKKGTVYGTVSSSLIAVPAADPRSLIWRYAAGSPDVAPYRNYGNLGRRLCT